MSDQVLVALIGLVGVVTVGWMERTRRDMKRDVGSVKYEVTANGGGSSYDTLRRDMHGITGRVAALGTDVANVRRDVSALHEANHQTRASLDESMFRVNQELYNTPARRRRDIADAIRKHEQDHHLRGDQ